MYRKTDRMGMPLIQEVPVPAPGKMRKKPFAKAAKPRGKISQMKETPISGPGKPIGMSPFVNKVYKTY